jgi:hypothetical protein|tara:strand:- start:216 stop:563 length:348 start_codon:yes stop_codon:yes gene_type:complete
VKGSLLLPVLYVENSSKQKTQKNIVLIAVQPGDKRRLKMEFTCIECENKYTPDKTGDAEERTCFECLNKEEKTDDTVVPKINNIDKDVNTEKFNEVAKKIVSGNFGKKKIDKGSA